MMIQWLKTKLSLPRPGFVITTSCIQIKFPFFAASVKDKHFLTKRLEDDGILQHEDSDTTR